MLASIDTVSLRLPVPLPERGQNALDALKEVSETTTGTTIVQGRLGNLRVFGSDAGVRIVGSLHKLVNPDGTNLTPVADADLARGVEAISDALGVDIRAARLSRVDIGASMPLPRPVSEYLRAFGEADRAVTRAHLRETLAFTTANHAVVLYDKLREMSAHGETHLIPFEYWGSNVLRYELQLRRRLDHQLGREATGGLLADPDFVQDLRRLWAARFDKAPTRRSFSIKGSFDVTTFRDHLAAVGADARGGIPEIESMLAEVRKRGTLAERQYFRNRAWLRSLPERAGLTTESPAYAELREAVHRAAG